MNTEQRLDRLEELYEHQHHTLELLAIYIPKLTDILIRYWGVSWEHRRNMMAEVRGIQSFTELMDDDIQQHFKTHSFTVSKKKKEDYGYK